jgi:hypothetical protein
MPTITSIRNSATFFGFPFYFSRKKIGLLDHHAACVVPFQFKKKLIKL